MYVMKLEMVIRRCGTNKFYEEDKEASCTIFTVVHTIFNKLVRTAVKLIATSLSLGFSTQKTMTYIVS